MVAGFTLCPILDIFKTVPWDHGLVQALNSKGPDGLKRFNKTGLTGTVVANKCGKGRQLKAAAVTDRLEIFQME